jgi:alpha-tubulin suppressor-like RCC1 family protein
MNHLHDNIDLPRRTTLALLAGWLSGCGGGGGGAAGASGSGAGTGSGTGGSGSGSGSPAPALGTVAAAVAGSNQSIALRAAAVAPAVPTYTALLCGDNTWGQMGTGDLSSPQTARTVLATSTTAAATWKAVAAGGFHTLGIKSDGTLWAWGLNLNGQLGNNESGNGRYRDSPVQIGTAKDWLEIAAGDSHSLARSGTVTTQSLWSWGQNTVGQLGLNNTLSKSIPTKLTATATFKAPWLAIAANGSYCLVLQSNGAIYSWGDDSDGQLGQLTSATPLVPTPTLAPGQPAIAIAAGGAHALAIQQDRSLISWGLNDAGQLGLGNLTSTPAPTQVGLDTDWFAIAAGGSHCLAIKLDRTLWSWGANTDGQLGDGSTNLSNVPKQIGTNTTWVSVAAGRSHSMAIDISGKLWVWGRNAEGQLGNGTIASPVLIPTLVP